jgi:hypothetical protein
MNIMTLSDSCAAQPEGLDVRREGFEVLRSDNKP